MFATVTAALSGLPGPGSAADILRLVAVPAFAWAAYRDVRTRRIPNRLWPPLVAVVLGAAPVGVVVAGGDQRVEVVGDLDAGVVVGGDLGDHIGLNAV